MKKFLCFVLLALLSPAAFPLKAQEIKPIFDESPETIRSQFVPLDSVNITGWRTQTGSQSCQSVLHNKIDNGILTADFSFSGEDRIEYLGLMGSKEIKEEGLYIGVRAEIVLKDGSKVACPFNIRLSDKSGETHQIALKVRWGDWYLGQIKSSSPHWGGDENGKLEFPCQFSTLIMDRAETKWKKSGTITVLEFAFFKRQKTEKAITAVLPDLKKGTNIFEPSKSNRSVKIDVQPLKKYRDKKIDLSIIRQINGEMLPAQRMTFNDFKEFTLSGKPGFESIQVAPITKNADGREIYQTPLKFSFAVLSKNADLNKWFGVCTHRNQLALNRVPRAGIGFIRDEFYWRGVEREKGKYFFDKYSDEYYDRATKMGVEILMILDYSNKFYDNDDFPHTEEGIAAFARYCAATAEHLKGRCRYFEIWNEWTGGCGMHHATRNKDKKNTPENYVKLIKAASEAIRKVIPNAYIIGGGGDHHVGHFTAISKMMELGIMKYCDAFSVHPYVYPRSPEKAQCRDDLQKVIDVMRANGCAHPKLWLTELGWPTYRGLTKKTEIDSWSFTLEDYSASMMVRSSIVYKSLPEIETYFWYDLENDGTDLYYNENNFGMVQNRAYGCQPKASYVAMANLTQLLNNAKVTVSQKYTTDNRQAYLIEKSNGQKVLGLWINEKEEDFDLPDCRAFGIYGNELGPKDRKLSTRPIFFELSTK